MFNSSGKGQISKIDAEVVQQMRANICGKIPKKQRSWP